MANMEDRYARVNRLSDMPVPEPTDYHAGQMAGQGALGSGVGFVEASKRDVRPLHRDDPWKHRAQGMRCGTCMWFVPKARAEGDPSNLGRCRRHAPTMNGFPAVFDGDWCGDHRLDENKV